MPRKILNIYTDGACRGNPGPGGWGALLEYQGVTEELNGYEADTTNNRMELTAAIMALSRVKRPCRICLTTDSRYLRDGITRWIHEWKRNGWKTANRKPVKNEDLWKQLDTMIANLDIEWHWVKAHNGHPENERADYLANQSIDRMLAE